MAISQKEAHFGNQKSFLNAYLIWCPIYLVDNDVLSNEIVMRDGCRFRQTGGARAEQPGCNRRP